MADVQPNALPTQSTASATDILVVQNGSTGTVAQMPVSGAFYAGSVVPNTLQSAAGTSWAWRSYTPVWGGSSTNPVIGNGTIVGKYVQIGKTVKVRILLINGTTTTIGSGNYTLSLPVTGLALSDAAAVSTQIPLGNAYLSDISNTSSPGLVYMASATTVGVRTIQTFSGTNPVQLNSINLWQSNNPFVPDIGDTFGFYFEYEAA